MRLPLETMRRTRQRLLTLVNAERGLFFAVLALQLGASFAAASMPWIIGTIIDAVTAGTTQQWVLWRLALIGVLVVANAILVWNADKNARVLGERIFARLREDLVSNVVQLPLSTVESAGTGDLLGRTQHDVQSVQYLVRNGLSAIITMVATVLSTFVAAVFVAPQLFWVMILEIPLVLAVSMWYLPRAIPAYRAVAADQARFAGTLSETADQGVTVDALRIGELRFLKARSLIIQMWRLERYAAWVRAVMVCGIVFITLMPMLLLVWLGAWLIPSGAVTAGAVTAVVMYCYQIRGPLWELAFWLDEVQFAFVGLQRIFGVGAVEADREVKHLHAGFGPIEIDTVSYAYRDGAPVLHDVSLILNTGETLAIVGPSGAGKSTLGRMIAGIHPPTSGRVHSGGVALVDIPEEELRTKVALVTQEHHVFVGTVAENLRLAASQASDSELWEALAAVGADTWVRTLPKGLEETLGSGGRDVTPSQAQQIALARVILLNPETVVLDEATSLLDPTAVSSIEAGLAKVLSGRTVVAIAHKLDTAAAADRIAVMVDGRIVELGHHEALVASGGQYARLWQAWTAQE